MSEQAVDQAIDRAAFALWQRTAEQLHLGGIDEAWQSPELREKYRGLVRLVLVELAAALPPEAATFSCSCGATNPEDCRVEGFNYGDVTVPAQDLIEVTTFQDNGPRYVPGLPNACARCRACSHPAFGPDREWCQDCGCPRLYHQGATE